MREDHQRVFLDNQFVVFQALVQFVGVFIDDSAERHCDVSKGNDDVALDVGIFRRLEEGKEEAMILFAELGADTKEFTERQGGRRAQNGVLRGKNMSKVARRREVDVP